MFFFTHQKIEKIVECMNVFSQLQLEYQSNFYAAKKTVKN